MATFKAVILKGDVHIREDKTTNVKIRITHNQSYAYVSTDVYVYPDSFENGSVVKGGKDIIYQNDKIITELSKFQKGILSLISMCQN